jgi:hypothetical protein
MALRGPGEAAIVRHVRKLIDQGYPPQLTDIEEMANSLLMICNQKPVSKTWAANFVKRYPELKVKFNQKYAYNRVLCEDPEVIQCWFCLVQNC